MAPSVQPPPGGTRGALKERYRHFCGLRVPSVCRLRVSSREPADGTVPCAAGALPGNDGGELEPVAPRIAHMEAALTWNLGVVGPPDLDTEASERSREILEHACGADEQCRMCLRRRLK